MANKTIWKPTDNRFVAFFDILGFKDMVMRSKHEDIYHKLYEISKTNEWIENLPKETEDQAGNGEIYIVSFSDSIVLFSKNDDLDNFKFFLLAVRYLFSKAIENNIPLKGGMAHGEISLNKNKQIYFGQAIIDAYLMEEDVNYFGVVAHNTIDNYITKYSNSLQNEYIDNLLFECKTPLKCGKIEHRNINWFKTLSITDEVDDNEKRVELTKNKIKEFKAICSGSPRRYVDNTLEIIDIINI